MVGKRDRQGGVRDDSATQIQKQTQIQTKKEYQKTKGLGRKGDQKTKGLANAHYRDPVRCTHTHMLLILIF